MRFLILLQDAKWLIKMDFECWWLVVSKNRPQATGGELIARNSGYLQEKGET